MINKNFLPDVNKEILEYEQLANKLAINDFNTDKEISELLLNDKLIDNYLNTYIEFIIKDDLPISVKNMFLDWLEMIHMEFHDRDIDTGISKSLDVNIKGIEHSIEICNKFKKLAEEEKEVIKEETSASLSQLRKFSKSDITIQYNGLSLQELNKLYDNIVKSNEILVKIDKILNLQKSLQFCSSTSIRNKSNTVKNFSADDVRNEILKINNGLDKYITTNKDVFPNVGIGKLSFSQKTKLIHFVGCHPGYKKNLKDKTQLIQLTKNQSLLTKLFESKKNLIFYLDWVINSPTMVENTLATLKNMTNDLRKLQEENPKLYRLSILGINQVRNYSRFYAVLVYKVNKGSKFISRKIRLIQTKLKHLKVN